MRRLNRSASEGISALRCSKTEAREMPQGPERERKSSRLSYLIVNPSSGQDVRQVSSTLIAQKQKYQLNCGLFSFLMDTLIRKV